MSNKYKCLLCRTDRISFLFYSANQHGRHILDANDRFRVYFCDNCGAISLPGVLVDDEYYQKYYDNEYYTPTTPLSGYVSNQIIRQMEAYSFNSKRKLILKYYKNRSSKISILDIGCGAGKFLESLPIGIFERYGLEINPEGVRQARTRGINIYDDKISNIDFGSKKFDVITMWHVLEHLNEPHATVRSISQVLSDGGILVLSTPNSKSMGFRYGQKNWFHLDSPRHLIIYNAKSLDFLFNNTGLISVGKHHEFADYPLDLLWSLKNSSLKYLIYPMYPIWKYLSQEHITVIYKKSYSTA